MRVFYYISNRIQTLANIHITCDEGLLYLISDLNTSTNNKTFEEQDIECMLREKVCKNRPYENGACNIKFGCLTGALDKAYQEYRYGTKR